MGWVTLAREAQRSLPVLAGGAAQKMEIHNPGLPCREPAMRAADDH
jgi:hypothetical protein